MISATFSELRNNARKYFDAVERGETIEVYRHGKPVAMITPYVRRSLDRWKTAHPLKIKGVSISRAIIEERRKGR